MSAKQGGRQYLLRLPSKTYDRIQKRAAQNGRVMNTEIVFAIEDYLVLASDYDRIIRRYEDLEKRVNSLEESRTAFGGLFSTLIHERLADSQGLRRPKKPLEIIKSEA